MALPHRELPIDHAHQSVIALHVKSFHDACLALASWPKLAVDFAEADVWRWIATNHRNNCLLWDEEDLARRTRASDAEITANKRAIDGYNQARNDATERVDEFLLLSLGLIDPATIGTDQPLSMVNAVARLSSETAGSMMDRMSIMSLKIKAMTAQTVRTDVDDLLFWGVLMKPGYPLAFGVVESTGTLVFGLPGNPVSTAVTFEQFQIETPKK